MIARRVLRQGAGVALGLALLGVGAGGGAGCASRRPADDAESAHAHDRTIKCVAPVPPDPATERGKRIAWLSQAVDGALTATTAPDALANASSSDLARAALATIVIHQDGTKAQALLEPLLRRELLDTSDARGTFVQTGDAPNAHELETVALPLVPILTKFRRCVTASFRDDLERGLHETIGALRRDAVRHKVAATRAWLEASVALAALGEALGDVAAAQQGETQIDEWDRTAALHGIAEYGAADDEAAALEALTFGNLYISTPGTRTNCQRAVQLLWSDLAARWFPPQNRIAGPASYRPDPTTASSVDGAQVLAALAGWSDPPADAAPIALSHVTALLGALDAGYLPDDDTRALFGPDDRAVTESWSDPDHPEPGHQTYIWITKDVAIGATSARAPQRLGVIGATASATARQTFDRPVDIRVAATDAAPFDIGVRAGARALPITTTAAQDRGALLLLVSSPLSGADAAGDVATELTLPMPDAGELAVDGRRSGAQLAMGAVIGVRAGTGGYAVQIAAAQGCHATPHLELRADPEAKLAHVRIVHGTSDATHACRARVVLSIAAGHATSHAELATLMESAHATVVERTADVKMDGPRGKPPAPVTVPLELTSWSASVRIDRGAWKGSSLMVERRELRKPNDAGEYDVLAVTRRSGGKTMLFGPLSENTRDLTRVLDEH